MTGDIAEWQPYGEILYTDSHEIPRLKIIMKDHMYEIQASKFHPIMRVFAVLVDGRFSASTHDSLDRLLQLDEVSKSNRCSEKEKMLADKIEILNKQIESISKEKDVLEQKLNDRKIIIFDGV